MLKLPVAILIGLLLACMQVALAWASSDANLRFTKHTDFTRIILESPSPFAYRAFTLAAPPRLIIDMPANKIHKIALMGEAKGLVGGTRSALFKPAIRRLVIDAKHPFKIKNLAATEASTNKNFRLIADISKADTTLTFKQTAAAWQDYMQSLTTKDPPPSPPKKPKQRLIVIDAGHGGIDPGAITQSHNYEKHITLKAAQHVKSVLEASGRYRVILTRNNDTYLPLRARFRIAEKHVADLFISLHADTVKRKNVRGASVYTLSEEASDAEVEELARQENAADKFATETLGNDDPQLAYILTDMQQHSTKQESVQFAMLLVNNMQKNIKILNNPHRFAGFAVLKSPTVPSALIEMGFISNRKEEKLLNTEAFRNKFAKSLQTALDEYFAEETRTASTASTP